MNFSITNPSLAKSMKRISLWMLVLALGVMACDPYEPSKNEFEKAAEAPVTAGTANFSKYVAVGNSLTAGFADNALYLEGQQNSYPLILQGQMRAAGAPSTFVQPLIPAGDGVGTTLVGTPPNHTILARQFPTIAGTIPALTVGQKSFVASANPALDFTGTVAGAAWRPAGGFTGLQNFGVPGVTMGGATSTMLGNAALAGGNPYYNRFATSPGTSTLIGDAVAAAPTFWTFHLGNNDVLGYATAGGANPAAITANSTFITQLDAAIDPLVGVANSKGVVVNIPDVTAIAFFQAIPARSFPPAPTPTFDATTTAGINGLWAAYLTQLGIDATPLGGLPAGVTAGSGHTNPTFLAASRANGIMFVASNGKIRMTNPRVNASGTGDLICLTAQLAIPQPGGVSRGITPPLTVSPTGGPNIFSSLAAPVQGIMNSISGGANVAFLVPNAGPLGTQFVLDEAEISTAQSATAGFNAALAAKVNAINASSKRVALYDAFTFFNSVAANGVFIGDSRSKQLLTNGYLSGGLFSMDGVHPSPAGYAVLANQIILTINREFCSTLKPVDASRYRTYRVE